MRARTQRKFLSLIILCFLSPHPRRVFEEGGRGFAVLKVTVESAQGKGGARKGRRPVAVASQGRGGERAKCGCAGALGSNWRAGRGQKVGLFKLSGRFSMCGRGEKNVGCTGGGAVGQHWARRLFRRGDGMEVEGNICFFRFFLSREYNSPKRAASHPTHTNSPTTSACPRAWFGG
jgi:hypothetical protein